MKRPFDSDAPARRDLVAMLSAAHPQDREALRRGAEETLLARCGDAVYFRGLIEFSNICSNDCLYCGIRIGNGTLRRYLLREEEIVAAALEGATYGYGSVVLQSGERRDEPFISFVERAVAAIKRESRSERLPEGLGVTLCVGEQSEEAYRRFFAAGAHRYLLRIETSNRRLFAAIHPPGQTFDSRVESLAALKRVGFQVGTGVMIGLPGQTVGDLADDLLFFKAMDIDMIGMGPYIAHCSTPMADWPGGNLRSPRERLELSLRMIAAARILLKDVNIAATTALQALDPAGRELGLRWGANVVMPLLTPPGARFDYQLYNGKPCLDESAGECRACLEKKILSVGRTIGYDEWGDAPHFKVRTRLPAM